MRWGVTYSALLFNMVFTMEVFLLTKNLLTLLLCAPIHGVCMLLCARDARFFDLVLLWARTRLPALFANLRVWKASSYCPLVIDLPDRAGAGGAIGASTCSGLIMRHDAPAALRREISAADRIPYRCARGALDRSDDVRRLCPGFSARRRELREQ